jgi:hypothetical protein
MNTMSLPRLLSESLVIVSVCLCHAEATQEGSNIVPIATAEGRVIALASVGGPLETVVREAKTPRRFEGYVPQFRVEWRTFTFNHVKGPEEKQYRVVWDGDRFVALVQSGDIHLAAFSPDSASKRIALTTGRYHMDQFVGPKIDFHQFCFGKPGGTPGSTGPTNDGKWWCTTTDVWERAEGQLSLVRKELSPGREVENRLLFSVDPVFGYRIDGTYYVSSENMKTSGLHVSGHVYCPGTYVPWEKHRLYDYAVYSRHQDPPGKFRGWPCSLYGIDRANRSWNSPVLSDPGFVAYTSHDPNGFSPCLTRDDGTGPKAMGQCNAGHGPGFSVTLTNLVKNAEGRYVFRCTRRLFGLPPEFRDHILARYEQIEARARGTFVRIGVTEDFEGQPFSLTNAVRGMIWTSGEPPIATNIARSGAQSLTIAGRVWPNLPQVILEPETRYRMEAWFHVVPWTDAEKQAVREKAAKEREQKKAKGQPVGEETDPGAVPPKAWIDGDLYEWSPHVGPMLVKQRTTEATGEKQWERVALEFTTPKWDPFINIVFQTQGCRAYMDDFRIAPVGGE